MACYSHSLTITGNKRYCLSKETEFHIWKCTSFQLLLTYYSSSPSCDKPMIKSCSLCNYVQTFKYYLSIIIRCLLSGSRFLYLPFIYLLFDCNFRIGNVMLFLLETPSLWSLDHTNGANIWQWNCCISDKFISRLCSRYAYHKHSLLQYFCFYYHCLCLLGWL